MLKIFFIIGALVASISALPVAQVDSVDAEFSRADAAWLREIEVARADAAWLRRAAEPEA